MIIVNMIFTGIYLNKFLYVLFLFPIHKNEVKIFFISIEFIVTGFSFAAFF